MTEELPAAGALEVGIAERRIPAPLGIGTMGFGPIGLDPNPTPFVDVYPGTERVHGELTMRAVAISRGDAHEVILVRTDTIGIFQQLREAVLDLVEERIDRRLDDSLIIAGNHTHSGPGRLLMSSGALATLAGPFFPEFYDALLDSIATVIVDAIADQAPAEIGHAIAQSTEGHSDRRCENDALPQVQEVPDLPLVAVRREGRLDAVIGSYAYHGTVIGISDLTLTGDMGSTVEQKIEERFDHPVMVLFFNSWGADMAPGNPTPGPDETGADQPGDYDRMDRVGDVIADAIVPVLEGITYSATPDVRARTYRVDLDRASIDYEDGVFNYPHGGAFCGGSGSGDCERNTPNMGLANACVPISARENLPKQTTLTAGQLGSLFFVTAPGEWSTALAAGVLDQVRAESGGDAMLIGYANDYNGYSIGESDWYMGGYETSGALWGPRQGDYLAARLVESFETFHGQLDVPPFCEPARVEPFSGYEGYALYEPEAPVGLGAITEDVPAAVTQTDIVSFVVSGSDPWLGTPVATLERDTGGGVFEPVIRTNGEPVDSRSYDFWIDLAVDPPYVEDEREESRTFGWRVSLPISRRSRSAIPTLSGPHRFSIAVPAAGGEMTVTTGTFDVAE